MNDPETRSAPKGDPEDLRQQCASLQRQVTTLLLAVFVLSGTLTVFLWRQARYARADLEVLKLPAAQIIQTFKQEKPIMDDFFVRLNEFSKTHPDFAPILAKYRVPPTTAAATTSAPPAVVAPPPASVPSPAGTQKK
jgi:hypothetical protein